MQLRFSRNKYLAAPDIDASATATRGRLDRIAGASLLGVERLRKANEASIRANIQSFVERLREAMKPKPAVKGSCSKL